MKGGPPVNRPFTLILVFGALAFQTLLAYLPPSEASFSSSTFTEPNWEVPVEKVTGHRADKILPTIADISYRLFCITPEKVSHGTPILQFDLRK